MPHLAPLCVSLPSLWSDVFHPHSVSILGTFRVNYTVRGAGIAARNPSDLLLKVHLPKETLRCPVGKAAQHTRRDGTPPSLPVSSPYL